MRTWSPDAMSARDCGAPSRSDVRSRDDRKLGVRRTRPFCVTDRSRLSSVTRDPARVTLAIAEMSDSSSIEWTEATWNPTRGCTRVSPGCQHCYAERFAHRLGGEDQPYAG